MDERDEQELVELIGTVSGVIYQNEESGYTVLRLHVGGEKPLTVVGCLPFASPGEGLEVLGSWEKHPTHGEQFKAVSAKRSLPVGEKQIYAYLASGAVKGIGSATATLIVEKFGADSLRIISENPEKLAEVRGISLRKAKEFSETFRRQAGLRALMEFLSANALRPEYALRLYKCYGDEAPELLRANPYLLCGERIGGRFGEADALALSLGFEDDSPERICAGLIYELRYNLQNGHTFLTREKLVAATAQLLSVPADAADEGLDLLADAEDVVICPLANVTAVYLSRMYEAETYVAARLREMAGTEYRPRRSTDTLLRNVEAGFGLHYAPLQLEALKLAATRQVMALTGGPGTGKTTTIRGILAVLDELGEDVVLCAPTGRAAKRMAELTGREAYTIHRLLGAGWSEEDDAPVFRRDEDDPLRCGAVILDECSMVDIALLNALLRAMPKDCRLILVGDADQLPSVGPGSVFLDILRSGVIASVRLTEVFRQGEESRIVRNAHAINEGSFPDWKENVGDFFFLQRGTGERICSTVTELCRDRLPKSMGVSPMDIQVLTPTRVGESGTYALNAVLQSALNPPAPDKAEQAFGERIFREGDRVMQIRNNYDLPWTRGREAGNGIFNGDVGRILSVDTENELLMIDFDDKLTAYGFDQLGELELAYAMTVHKSQGSEYPAVVLAVGRTPARLISRDLLYTAVTRARRLLVIVGDHAIAEAMIESARRARRYSGLRIRLVEEK